MGKKYIIEKDDNESIWSIYADADGDATIKGVSLTHYTEDSAYAHGFTEAESKFREIRDELEKQAYQKGHQDAYDTAYKEAKEIYESGKRPMYQKGLSDAWEAVRWLSKSNAGVNFKVFGMHFTSEIVQEISASEAIEKIRQYEREKEEQEEKDSVTAEDVMRQYLDAFCHGRNCETCPLNTPNFTCGRGRHFFTSFPVSDEEVRKAYTTVMQKMKEK